MSAGVMITGNGIQMYRLLALKGAIKLEALGMRRRGTSATEIARRELGIKGNRQKVLDALLAKIEAYKAEIQPGNFQQI